MEPSDGGPMHGLLASFSPSADVLALSFGDGRIKTWDVSSGQIRADLTAGDASGVTNAAGGLSSSSGGLHFTTLAWESLSKPLKKKKARAHAPLLAAASSTGDILAWDAALGELRWRTTAAHAGSATALAFAPQGAALISGGADGQVCQMQPTTGALLGKDRLERHGVSALAVSPDGAQLLVGSARIRLVDLASKKKTRKLAGHASSVRALAFSPDGAYGLSAALGERHVAVWDLQAPRSDSGAQAAAALLALEEPAVSLSCSGAAEGPGVTIVAVAQSGDAYVWRGEGMLAAAAAEPCRIRVARKEAVSGRIQAVLAAQALEGGSVLIAYGSAAAPHFQTLPPSRLLGGPLVLSPAVDGALLAKEAAAVRTEARQAQPAVAVVGPDSGGAGVAATLHPGDMGAGQQRRKKRGADRADAPEDASVGAMDVEAAGDEGAEVTLGERVAALDLGGADGDKDAEAGRHGGGGAGAGGVAGSGAPRAHSLQVLLTQALASQDGQLLEKCLAVGDEKVISNTVRRLRPSDASALLSSLTAKLQAKPSRGVVLLPWIRAALLQHAGSFMAAPGAQPSLLALHQLIEARLAVFKPLLALSGRLDLMMAQISAVSDAHVAGSNDGEVDASTAVYEEGHSEEEVEVEEVGAMESSDSDEENEDEENGEWGTDEEEEEYTDDGT